jgi:hypothetical protein
LPVCVGRNGVGAVLDMDVVSPPDGTPVLSADVGAVEVIVTVKGPLLVVEGGVISVKVVDVGGLVNDEKVGDVTVLLLVGIDEVSSDVGGESVDDGGVSLDVGVDELGVGELSVPV